MKQSGEISQKRNTKLRCFHLFLMTIFKNTFELATMFSTEICFLMEKNHLNSYICEEQSFQECSSAGVFCLAVEEDNKGNGAHCVAFLSEGCSNSGNKMALKMLNDTNRYYGLILYVPPLEYEYKPFQCAFSCDMCLTWY